MLYEKSCGFVVCKKQHNMRLYLIIRATSGEYGFPKGHIEHSETELETAFRELKEETNIDVEVIAGFRRQIEYTLPNKINVIKQSVYFLGKYIGGNIICQEAEVSKAEFVPIEEALKLLSFDDIKSILKDADAYLSTTASA